MAARSKRNVVVDRHVEGIGLLEHHANRLAELVEILLVGIDIVPAILNLARNTATTNLAIHEVEAAQEGRLATARRANECRNLIFVERKRGVMQRVVRTIMHVYIARLKNHFVRHCHTTHTMLLLARAYARHKIRSA